MSILTVADDAIHARDIAHELCEILKNKKADSEAERQLRIRCRHLSQLLDGGVSGLEKSLVDEGETVSVSFFPFDRWAKGAPEAALRERSAGYKTAGAEKTARKSSLVLPSKQSAIRRRH
ncbi:MAG: hypothetical protein MAG453_00254 [Calditrichaeota bacterium]|nr:hypothetical protein [Calditrichota bacterium]